MKARHPLWVSCSVAALALLALAAYSLKLFEPLPLNAAASSSRLVVDTNGRLLRAFTTEDGKWRLKTTMADVIRSISPAQGLRGPALQHWGVDPRWWRPGLWIARGHIVSGASTLSMQAARLLAARAAGCPPRDPSGRRAARSRRYSKREVLAIYLSWRRWAAISRACAPPLSPISARSPSLSAAEAALLVAIPQSPSRRRPDRSACRGASRRARVLQRGLSTA